MPATAIAAPTPTAATPTGTAAIAAAETDAHHADQCGALRQQLEAEHGECRANADADAGQ
ncbi:hypothetical protein [Jidongwangia harbinensis]|uniref:hypothetical protein n=1 Tax=Jidongwangia harbinensis TaxID=2878561 RepID=UPI001CD92AB9|nr:hypothetical protein [Jidongwangia harbinensis]MCA2218030.1 hypothetical protein [Jidongwangia harbinensis]